MSNVGGVSNASNIYANNYSNANSNVNAAVLETASKTQDTDAYVPSTDSGTGIYTAKDPATIQRLWDEANAATQALRNIVASMLGIDKNGNTTGQAFWAMRADAANFNIEVDDETRLEAERMIGADGYYGVEKTTARIMEFAKALGGADADEKTIENLRSGVQEGFDAIAEAFGGFDKLPEVTKQTYDAIMTAFDDWKAANAQ